MKLSLSLLLTSLLQAGAGLPDCHCDLLELTERSPASSR